MGSTKGKAAGKKATIAVKMFLHTLYDSAAVFSVAITMIRWINGIWDL